MWQLLLGLELTVMGQKRVKVRSTLSSPSGKVQWVPSRLQAQGNSVMIVRLLGIWLWNLSTRSRDLEVMPHCSNGVGKPCRVYLLLF
jgi:hypothetical protein